MLGLLLIALAFSLAATYHDLRTGEIPDKFSVGLIIVALAIRAIYGVYFGDLGFFADGMLVAAAFFVFGAAVFYSGGWGGGDAKLLTGIGAALGGVSGGQPLPPFLFFFILMALVSVPYTLSHAIRIALHSDKSKSQLRKEYKAYSVPIIAILAMAIFIFATLRPPPLMSLSLLMVTSLLPLSIFVRTVEKTDFQKDVSVKDLKIGDIVAKDVVVGGKTLISRRNMDGLNKETIREIQKYSSKGKLPKKIRIRWGIRLGPVFPLALTAYTILTLYNFLP